MSSAISSMLRVTVVAERGTCAIFLTAASPRSSRQMSLVVGRINSSSVVNGFLALAIRLATKYDALSALAFVDVVWPSVIASVLLVHAFFFQNTPKACLLMQGAWSPSGEAVLKASLPH